MRLNRRHGIVLAGLLLLPSGQGLAQMTGGGTTGGGTTGGTNGGGQTTGGGTTGGGTGGTGMSTFAPTQGAVPLAPSSFLPGASSGVPGAAANTTSANPFMPFYANPLALGLATSNPDYRGAAPGGGAGGAGPAPWGTALYSNVYSTGNTTRVNLSTQNLNRGGLGNGLNGGLGTSGRVPGYVTRMEGAGRAAANLQLQRPQLEQVIRNSSALANRGIQLEIHAGAVILKGVVASERERKLAENMLRLSPGVSVVRNELTVAP